MRDPKQKQLMPSSGIYVSLNSQDNLEESDTTGRRENSGCRKLP
jgi:hypothetical protein